MAFHSSGWGLQRRVAGELSQRRAPLLQPVLRALSCRASAVLQRSSSDISTFDKVSIAADAVALGLLQADAAARAIAPLNLKSEHPTTCWKALTLLATQRIHRASRRARPDRAEASAIAALQVAMNAPASERAFLSDGLQYLETAGRARGGAASLDPSFDLFIVRKAFEARGTMMHWQIMVLLHAILRHFRVCAHKMVVPLLQLLADKPGDGARLRVRAGCVMFAADAAELGIALPPELGQELIEAALGALESAPAGAGGIAEQRERSAKASLLYHSVRLTEQLPGVRGQQLRPRCAAAIRAQAPRLLHHLGGSDLAMLAAAMKKLGVTDDPALLASLGRRIQVAAPRMGRKDLVIVLEAVAHGDGAVQGPPVCTALVARVASLLAHLSPADPLAHRAKDRAILCLLAAPLAARAAAAAATNTRVVDVLISAIRTELRGALAATEGHEERAVQVTLLAKALARCCGATADVREEAAAARGREGGEEQEGQEKAAAAVAATSPLPLAVHVMSPCSDVVDVLLSAAAAFARSMTTDNFAITLRSLAAIGVSYDELTVVATRHLEVAVQGRDQHAGAVPERCGRRSGAPGRVTMRSICSTLLALRCADPVVVGHVAHLAERVRCPEVSRLVAQLRQQCAEGGGGSGGGGALPLFRWPLPPSPRNLRDGPHHPASSAAAAAAAA